MNSWTEDQKLFKFQFQQMTKILKYDSNEKLAKVNSEKLKTHVHQNMSYVRFLPLLMVFEVKINGDGKEKTSSRYL